MKNEFVADGFHRFLRGRKTAASKAIKKIYAAELANADSAEKRRIHGRMAEEFLRREKALNHKPSPATLW